MVTTGVHKKDTNSLSDFDFFSLVQIVKFFKKSDLYYWQVELTLAWIMILVSAFQKTLMKATFGKKLFYVSTMKGIINNKINILYKAAVFKLYYCRPELS